VVEREEKRFRWIGNLRLAAGIAAGILCFFVFGPVAVSPWWLCLPVSAFLALVVIHSRVVGVLERARRAARFYERGLARVEDRWAGTGEMGERFRDPQHVYAEDLDLFGKGSLYELLCTARTRAGEDTLARWLLGPAEAVEVIDRQAAVAELAPSIDLREDLSLLGEDVSSKLHADSLAAWGEGPAVHFAPLWRPIAFLIGAGTFLTLIGYLAGWMPRIPVLVFAMVQIALRYVLHNRVEEVVEHADSPAHELELLAELLRRIEQLPAGTAALNRMRESLIAEGLIASAQIGRLERLISVLDWRRNQLFTPIAAVLMWPVHFAIAIEAWRHRAGGAIRRWIDAAGEFEALCALAAYRFERPADTFPELVEAAGLFEAEELAHPLLPLERCVRNDLALGRELRLLIVSGSNMSGKSTLLRTVGLTTVLAWAGAPVRAKRLRLSRLYVGASIRLVDSLQDGRSRFYAEITRLRQIVALADGTRTVLFLMDELLSGTNSHDRLIGAEAIVRSLLERGAIGILTTHDLALANIAQNVHGSAVNVHFADTIEDGNLHFDYRLHPGVVTRSNALELMRSVGLDV
jgi:hypothetical protein